MTIAGTGLTFSPVADHALDTKQGRATRRGRQSRARCSWAIWSRRWSVAIRPLSCGTPMQLPRRSSIGSAVSTRTAPTIPTAARAAHRFSKTACCVRRRRNTPAQGGSRAVRKSLQVWPSARGCGACRARSSHDRCFSYSHTGAKPATRKSHPASRRNGRSRQRCYAV
jgi:hypothetical protein